MSQETPRVLTEAQRQFIDVRVADGDYEDPASVVQAGLDLLKEDEQRREREFGEAVQIGLDQLDRGEYIEVHGREGLHQFFEEINEEVRQEVAAEAEQGRA